MMVKIVSMSILVVGGFPVDGWFSDLPSWEFSPHWSILLLIRRIVYDVVVRPLDMYNLVTRFVRLGLASDFPESRTESQLIFTI